MKFIGHTAVEVAPGWNIIVPDADLDSMRTTPDEPFTLEPPSGGHVYKAACEFAVSRLGDGDGRRCLVLGSPPFEAQSLQSVGWRTVLVDVRHPPDPKTDFVAADAVHLPFQDSCFDSVSSTCCFCHVGLGRYGDPLHADGDVRALAEVFRVLKDGAPAVTVLGPSVPIESFLTKTTVSTMHRLYKPSEAVDRVLEAGFDIVEQGFWEAKENCWIDPQDVESYYGRYVDSVPYCYLCFLLRKPCSRRR